MSTISINVIENIQNNMNNVAVSVPLALNAVDIPI